MLCTCSSLPTNHFVVPITETGDWILYPQEKPVDSEGGLSFIGCIFLILTIVAMRRALFPVVKTHDARGRDNRRDSFLDMLLKNNAFLAVRAQR